jgi:hypothetical protein
MNRQRIDIEVMSLPEPGVGLLGSLTTSTHGAFDALRGGFDVAGCYVKVEPNDGKNARITVFRPGPITPRLQIEAEMKGAVQPYLLAVTLRTGVAVEMEWNSWTTVDERGERNYGAGGAFVVFKQRGDSETLGAYIDEAHVIEAHPALQAALEACVGARRLLGDHPGASMALSYVAVEGLVTHVLGNVKGSRTSLGEWREAAPLLSSNPDDLERLLHSAHLGRHVDPQNAKKKLQDRGWMPLDDVGCAEVALDIVSAYAEALLAEQRAAGAVADPADIAVGVADSGEGAAPPVDPCPRADEGHDEEGAAGPPVDQVTYAKGSDVAGTGERQTDGGDEPEQPETVGDEPEHDGPEETPEAPDVASGPAAL